MSITTARKGKRKRASALAGVRAGSVPVRDVLREPPRSLRTCPVHVLLLAAPGMGPQTMRKTLEHAGVWPLLTLSELNPRQRLDILYSLPRRIP